MDGILLIDKPKEWTSFDVVAKIRGILARSQFSVASNQQAQKTEHGKRSTLSAKPKVGHTGTLDPLATGLMVVVVGSYCKRASEFSKLDKVYEVTMTLGQTSTTGDEEGEKTAVSDKKPSEAAVLAALEAFTGEITQVPPAYSAIKVNGKRAYELARAGKAVALEPRKVTIYSISEVEYTYPRVTFTARVSSGTYIRSLAEDIGKKLGVGAYMSDLRRTQVGEFQLGQALSITEVAQANLDTHILTK